MTARPPISKWIKISIVSVFVVFALFVALVVRICYTMSEGVLQTDTLQGNVLVALSDDPPVRQALLSGCRSTPATPPSVSALLMSGQLASRGPFRNQDAHAAVA
jgi:hypothetical protein